MGLVIVIVVVIVSGYLISKSKRQKSTTDFVKVKMTLNYNQSDTDSEYSELLKKATALSADNIAEAINILNKAIQLKPTEFQAHKKLAGYLQLANRFDEAVDVLNKQLTIVSQYEISSVYDYLAVLYKKEKREEEAIIFESYSIYYYTTFSGPIAYRNPADFIENIQLKRKYKLKDLADNLNEKMKEFWGTVWLIKFHKKCTVLDNKARDIDDTDEKYINKIIEYTGDKTFEKYKDYIKEIS